METTVQQFPPFREDAAHHGHDDHGHGEHHEPNFWQKYIFSTDHKVIGIQYGLVSLSFMLFGFFLMVMMRWQIAHPGVPVPVIGPVLAALLGQPAAHGAISPDLYNSFGAMHGTIMVFLGVVPLAFAAFGNFVVPLFRQGYNGDQDGTPVDALPHYIPPNENLQSTPALAKRYPLSLITPKSHALAFPSGKFPRTALHILFDPQNFSGFMDPFLDFSFWVFA